MRKLLTTCAKALSFSLWIQSSSAGASLEPVVFCRGRMYLCIGGRGSNCQAASLRAVAAGTDAQQRLTSTKLAKRKGGSVRVLK